MTVASLLAGLLVGVLQGLLEWLPVSSEGLIALLLAAFGHSPAAAVQYALVLHLGTALAATAYYRASIVDLLGGLSVWHPATAFDAELAELSFLGLATLVSGVVGIGVYLALMDLVNRFAAGGFIAAIGALLILTGLLQRLGAGIEIVGDREPGLLDALLVGVGQGVAVLPGVSRSGTTVSLLLLRGHDAEASFELSFLLSIPAAVGAAGLAAADAGLGVSLPGIVALAASAIVGYLALDALMRLARRVAFWAVCVALGALAMAGGLLVSVG